MLKVKLCRMSLEVYLKVHYSVESVRTLKITQSFYLE